MHVYRIRLDPESKAVATGAPDAVPSPLPLPDKPIAVLPFQNKSGDPEQEYFADGMVEEIIGMGHRAQKCHENTRNTKALPGVGCAVMVAIVPTIVPEK